MKVSKLSKSYRISPGANRYQTLGDGLKSIFKREQKKTVYALKDVSFELKEGEVLGVIGGNGAGKSTLLKLLADITPPSKGEIRYKGKVASLLEVGTGFHPELSGRENIFFYGLLLGMDQSYIQSKFDEIVEFAGITEYLDTPIKRYSSGMQLRLAFAVAAHLDCDILLVDEVLAVGDAAFQKKSMNKMSSLAGSGRTVVMVSHNMTAIQKMCDRVIWLENGKVKKDGKAKAVVKAYLDSGKGAASRGSVKDLPRIGDLGSNARIDSVSVVSKGKAVSSLDLGQPFTVSLIATAKRKVVDASATIRIESDNGQAVAGPTSDAAGVTFDLKPKTKTEITAEFDIVLSPGDYWLTVGLRSGHQGLDQVEQAYKYTVSEATHGDTPPSPGTWGAVQTYPKWKHGKAK